MDNRINTDPTRIIIVDDVEATVHWLGVHEVALHARVQEIKTALIVAYAELFAQAGYVLEILPLDSLRGWIRQKLPLDCTEVSLDKYSAADRRCVLPLSHVANMDEENSSSWHIQGGEGRLASVRNNLSVGFPVWVTDIGADSGQAIYWALTFLQQNNIKVSGICLGISTDRAINLLGAQCSQVVVKISGRFLRWFELRDILGLTGKPVRYRSLVCTIPGWYTTLGRLFQSTRYEREILNLCREAQAHITSLGIPLAAPL